MVRGATAFLTSKILLVYDNNLRSSRIWAFVIGAISNLSSNRCDCGVNAGLSKLIVVWFIIPLMLWLVEFQHLPCRGALQLSYTALFDINFVFRILIINIPCRISLDAKRPGHGR